MIIWRTNLCIQLVYFLYQYNYVNIVPITLKYDYIAFILYLPSNQLGNFSTKSTLFSTLQINWHKSPLLASSSEIQF